MKPLAGTAFTFLLLGSALAGLQSMPMVDATCHCITSTCTFDDYDNNPKNGQFDFSEKETMQEEEGNCKEDAAVRLAAMLISGGDNELEVYLVADHVTVAGQGGVSIGSSDGTLVVRVRAVANASIANGTTFRAAAVTGMTFTSPSEVPVSPEGVSRIAFRLDEGASHLAVPYTVSEPGFAEQAGTLAMEAGETGGEGDLTLTEVALVSGIVGAILGAIIAAVVVLVSRRG